MIQQLKENILGEIKIAKKLINDVSKTILNNLFLLLVCLQERVMAKVF